MKRRLVWAALGVVTLGLLSLPVVLTILLGWYRTALLAGIVGRRSGIYVVLPLVYLAWAPLVVVGFVVAADRLGYHYTVPEDDSKPTRRERRRQRAALTLLAHDPSFGDDHEPGARAGDGG